MFPKIESLEPVINLEGKLIIIFPNLDSVSALFYQETKPAIVSLMDRFNHFA